MVKARENRVPIMMSEAELQEIDDWRFRNRIATRSEAVRRLCQIGLVVGGELESVTDVMMVMSSALSDLDQLAFELWSRINSPVMKGDALDRETISSAVESVLERIEHVEGGVSDVSSILVALFSAVAGLSKNEIGEGKRISDQAIKDVIRQLEEAQALRSQSRANRLEMKKYGYRKAQKSEGSE